MWQTSFSFETPSDLMACIETVLREAFPEGDPCIAKLKLVMEELCLNALTHGLKDKKKVVNVRVKLLRQEDRFRLLLSDDTAYFNAASAAEQATSAKIVSEVVKNPITLASLKVGGWGLQLVRGSVSSWHYERKGGWNVHALVWGA